MPCDYLNRIGARGTVEGPQTAEFPFVDVRTGQRWVLRPNRGRLPWWIFRQGRRVPQSRAADYLEALQLRRAGAAATVGEVLDPGRALFERLWEPLAVAALNTGVKQASAQLFWRILTETLARGGAACRPLVPRDGLSETFIDPALATLRKHGRGWCIAGSGCGRSTWWAIASLCCGSRTDRSSLLPRIG